MSLHGHHLPSTGQHQSIAGGDQEELVSTH